jgi:hypothetical protein
MTRQFEEISSLRRFWWPRRAVTVACPPRRIAARAAKSWVHYLTQRAARDGGQDAADCARAGITIVLDCSVSYSRVGDVLEERHF